MERAAPHAYPAPVRRQRPHSILAGNAFPVWDGATATRAAVAHPLFHATMATSAPKMTNARRLDAKERTRNATKKFSVKIVIVSLQSAISLPGIASANMKTFSASSAIQNNATFGTVAESPLPSDRT